MMARWLRYLIAIPRCLFCARYERLEDARNMQALAIYRGVHTVTENCPICDGWHVAIR